MAFPTDPGRSRDRALIASLQSALRPGEQLLWYGRPDPSVVFVAADGIAIPFSVVWLGITMLWALGAPAVGASNASRLIGAPFIVTGVPFLVWRFLTRWLGKRKTIYGITDQRVIAVIGSVVKDAPVRGGSMSFRRSRNGRHATVVFEPFGSYFTTSAPSMTGPPDSATGMPTMGASTRRRVAPGSLVFRDVADPDPMLAAINRAKA
jgi:hypothetical protein